MSVSAIAADPADRVLKNGDIETMDQAQPKAEAIAMKDGKIVYVGNNDGAEAFIGDKTDVIDLKGAYVTPGFVETHNHVVGSTWMTAGVSLRFAETPEEMAQTLKKYADENPDLKVVVGNGWLRGTLDRLPTAEDMDKAGIDRPVVAIGNYCHDAVFNTIAIEKAGIDLDTVKDLQPGVIYWERDENGRATGLGVEGQWAKGYVDIGAWNPKTMIPEASDYLQGYLVTQGVTTAVATGIMTPPVIINAEMVLDEFELAADILRERVNSGKAKMRLGIMPYFKTPDADPQRYVDVISEVREKNNDDMLWARGVKLHTEVAWNEGIATQFVPYLKPNEDGSPNYGQYGVTPDRQWELVTRANDADLDIVAHVNGAREVKRLIDIYLEARKKHPHIRNRLDHLDFCTAADQDRIVKHNIPVNATPGFANDGDAGLNGSALFAVVDKKYAIECYGSYSDLANRYDNVSLSGDTPGFPIEKAYPVWNMQSAMTLTNPDNPDSKYFPPWRKAMTIDQVLAAHTTIAAWQIRMEDKIGSLEVGKYADIAIFNKSLREIAPENLVKEGKVLATLLGGEFTFDGRTLSVEEWAELTKTHESPYENPLRCLTCRTRAEMEILRLREELRKAREANKDD